MVTENLVLPLLRCSQKLLFLALLIMSKMKTFPLWSNSNVVVFIIVCFSLGLDISLKLIIVQSKWEWGEETAVRIFAIKRFPGNSYFRKVNKRQQKVVEVLKQFCRQVFLKQNKKWRVIYSPTPMNLFILTLCVKKYGKFPLTIFLIRVLVNICKVQNVFICVFLLFSLIWLLLYC